MQVVTCISLEGVCDTPVRWLLQMNVQINRRRQWHPTPVLLPGKSHGRRSLVGLSPKGRWGSDSTERIHFHFSLSCIGEGDGNPLQCSCLENPRNREAWWAAVYGGSHRVGHNWSDLAAAAAAAPDQLVVTSNGASIYETHRTVANEIVLNRDKCTPTPVAIYSGSEQKEQTKSFIS